MKTITATLAATCLFAAIHVDSARAAGTDELWEITTRMEMAGMPMAMPGQTNTFCKPKGQVQSDPLPSDKNNDCQMVDMQQSGNTSRFKMRCSGKQPMTGEGEVTYTGSDRYTGKMHIVGKMEGASSADESVDMTQTFSGKKVGTCTYEDLGKKALAQSQAITADMCNKAIDEVSPYLFDSKMSGNTCDSFKPKFCARVNDLEKTMHTTTGYTETRKKYAGLGEAMALCGISQTALLPELCQKALKGGEWEFLTANCPAETRIAAKEHCAGRDYTSVMSGPYAPLCRAYAQQMTPAERAAAAGKQSVQDTVTEGVKGSLKKLLPF